MSTKPKRSFRASKPTRIVVTTVFSLFALIGVACVVIFVMGSILFGDVGRGESTGQPHGAVEYDDSNFEGESFNQEEYDKAMSVLELPLRGNEKGVRNILLVGVDSRNNNFKGLADTNMIVSINDNTKTIKLVSLLRDTWITVPGEDRDKDGKDDTQKLNYPFFRGGYTLHFKMIQRNFRLDIDDYIAVNFQVLPKLIDAMGGLDIYLTAKEITQIPEKGCQVSVRNEGFIQMKGEAGVHHLDGFQAMEYARIRKIDSDFQRTERQRTVVSLLMEKAKKMSAAQIVNMVYTAASYVDTNMTTDELLALAANAATYNTYTIEDDYSIPDLAKNDFRSSSLEGKGAGLLLVDPKETVRQLHTYLYGG